MRYASLLWSFAASSALASLALGVQACGDDNGTTPMNDASTPDTGADGTLPPDTGVGADGGADAKPQPEAGGGDAKADADAAADARPDATTDGGGADAGDAARPDGDAGAADAGPLPIFLVHFAPNQLPEGLWLLDGGEAGVTTPVVSWAPQATLVTVGSDGGVSIFGAVEAGAPTGTNTLGITTDPSGNVYVGIATFTPDAGVVPPPGVYKFPPTGGPGTLFSSDPAMNFPNGLDYIDGQLFVADSEGTIFTVDLTTGTATPWSSDPLLAPDPAACDGGLPNPIGANGIVHDTANVFVTNTNHGRIVKIPLGADGGAGTAATLIESCSALLGADGLVLDPTDNSLIVAANVQNKIVRVNAGGTTTTVLPSGGPLDFPASVVIQGTPDAGRRLLFTNLSLDVPDSGKAGLLAFPLP
ncbi:MAG: hypothetical protein JOZ69_20050 [Myxococcales bacterium]|nr:hypothetical protein [Myxococcales bacterium]